MKNLNKLSFLILTLSVNSFALDKIYYGDGIKDVFVNSHDSTLLLFQSPPIAKACQPNGVIELFPIESKEEIENISLIQGSDLTGVVKDNNSSKGIELMLKLSPYQENQATVCDIKLSSGETVSVKFKALSNMRRPLIEFQNIFSKSSKINGPSDSSDVLELFQKFTTGGELMDFVDQTTSHNASIFQTNIAKYEISYMGTDREKYKTWIFRTYPKKTVKELPSLRNIKINEVYFSLWKKDSSMKTITELEKGQTVNLYILSSSDIALEEMMRKLP